MSSIERIILNSYSAMSIHTLLLKRIHIDVIHNHSQLKKKYPDYDFFYECKKLYNVEFEVDYNRMVYENNKKIALFVPLAQVFCKEYPDSKLNTHHLLNKYYVNNGFKRNFEHEFINIYTYLYDKDIKKKI